MFKKNDKVIFSKDGLVYEGVVVGSPYRVYTKKEHHVEVLFNEIKEELPVNIKYLEKINE